MISEREAHKVSEHVNGNQGFYLGLKLHQQELDDIRLMVEASWINTIRAKYPKLVSKFLSYGIANYHKSSDLVDHGALWPKRARLLSEDCVQKILSMSIMKEFERAFGKFYLSDEEDLGYGVIFWRLVRPGPASTDMACMHADRWFWDMETHPNSPPHLQRVKVWIPLYNEPGVNGLRLVPGSHKKEWKHHEVEKQGVLKPQIDEDESLLDIQLMHTKPGEAVVFHDNLLHGGAGGNSQFTRVSFEFTLLVEKSL